MATSADNIAPASGKVLLVDDDAAMLRLVSRWMEGAGYSVRQASDGQLALEAIEAECPDFLVTDWEMPRLDGLELCRRVRELELPHYVYILFLTVKRTSGETVAALEVGADEFVTKPLDRAELLARMRSGDRVLQLERRLRELAHSDPLTGLLTRRTFFQSLAREWERSKRFRRPLSCVMVDIDFFKRVNDSHGHAAGDAVLKGVARELAAKSRKSDLVCRYGGEEFCLMLPETKEPDAARWAERFRKHLASVRFPVAGETVQITCSFGAAQVHDDTQTCEQLVDEADQALLCAKRSGRDRVVRFESLSDAGEKEFDEAGQHGGLFRGITAREVMTPVVACLQESETVGQAAEFFLRSRLNSTPVVDAHGRLSGILSEKDLMSALVLPEFWSRPIRESMKPNVICYPPDAPISTIYEFLCRVAIRRVVIAEEGRPVGTISRCTLLRWFRNMLATRGLLGSAVPPDDLSPTDSRSRLGQAARELADQVAQLEGRLNQEEQDLVPYVVGGVTRMQELVDDLLAHARYANRIPGDEGGLEAFLLNAHHSD
jgi:diguanylate cyclase (GGDEF)-like protein